MSAIAWWWKCRACGRLWTDEEVVGEAPHLTCGDRFCGGTVDSEPVVEDRAPRESFLRRNWPTFELKGRQR